MNQVARSYTPSSTLKSEEEKAPEVKMFISTQGPKRKESITYESEEPGYPQSNREGD
ncbi:hypothetical protein P7K49_024624 [Saguinus oedipus]|uniref:Uncharacterized protein n=1 Tax=Saguinus oedipus TaxID=9490 RepID=A0ABQ9URP5_SAGOE|nr:hypothetical protein P7K49_024624 [Saguinus oedipus]